MRRCVTALYLFARDKKKPLAKVANFPRSDRSRSANHNEMRITGPGSFYLTRFLRQTVRRLLRNTKTGENRVSGFENVGSRFYEPLRKNIYDMFPIRMRVISNATALITQLLFSWADEEIDGKLMAEDIITVHLKKLKILGSMCRR